MKKNKEEKTKIESKKREIEGVVVSNSMEKTVKVRVDTLESHPIYKKRVKRKKVYFAHTEEELEVGDKVVIRESRPYSKKIRWVVLKKV
ncbi:MAG: 30S ribosomal protein S17 [Candidatus Dojkabacteria bacterium]|jgi:small subunit ribosomal protein S17